MSRFAHDFTADWARSMWSVYRIRWMIKRMRKITGFQILVGSFWFLASLVGGGAFGLALHAMLPASEYRAILVIAGAGIGFLALHLAMVRLLLRLLPIPIGDIAPGFDCGTELSCLSGLYLFSCAAADAVKAVASADESDHESRAWGEDCGQYLHGWGDS